MTNKDLANLIFKDLKLTHEDCLKKYPKRNLPDNAIVTRYAPSPTGFVHMGNIYAAFIERKMAKQTNGVFYLRIEDTDQKRYVKDGIQRIIKDMKDFNIEFDECPLSETEEIGNYGPYIQSQRRDIYKAFVKYFVENTGIDPKRLSATGYGEHHPVVPNDTEENMAKNRRVNILIIADDKE